MKRKVFVLLAIMTIIACLSAVSYSESYQLNDVELSITEHGYDEVTFGDLQNSGIAGHPQLPVEIVNLIIPSGMEISNINITTQTQNIVGDYLLTPAQPTRLIDGIGYNEFDLIICDEAHRTTGVILSGSNESAFVKVHDNEFIKAKKRIYMTATPRLYSDDSKSKAAQNDAILCSMDDPKIYGEEIYRIGFGEAVERDLLTDYKVLILTIGDKDVSPAIQSALATGKKELGFDDITKLIGVVNALSKQVLGDEGFIKSSDPAPMKRAVAFCDRIKNSKLISDTFNDMTEIYLNSLKESRKEKMKYWN